jgi:7-cyano-7-deazaguanine synthase
MKRAVVLLSGGIDSTVTLALAKSDGFEVYAVSFDYGQRHRIELNLAKKNAASFKVTKHLIISFDLRDIGGSALTADIEVPKDRDALSVISEQSKDTSPFTHHPLPLSDIPVTYVPARNTIFLSFGLALAESIGAENIFIGANAVDYSGYPDCRPEYIQAYETMANLATKASVEGTRHFKIEAPLIGFTKGEIIKKGAAMGVDFSSTWSCYDPQTVRKNNSAEVRKKKDRRASELPGFHPDYVPCRHCDSCLLRAKGFQEAGIKDPLDLK